MTRKSDKMQTQSLIEQFLEEKGFSFENEADKGRVLKEAKVSLQEKEIIPYEDLHLEENENYVTFFSIKHCEAEDLEKLKQNIETYCIINKEKQGFDLFYLIVIVDKHSTKIKAEKWLREIRSYAKSLFKCASVTNIAYYVIQDSALSEEKYSIQIDSRLFSITMPRNEEEYHTLEDTSYPKKITSYVLTANLYDIINIYEHVSDALFNKNVRYKIKDVLDVEFNITKTLKEMPEAFWYLNNGITMIVNKDSINLGKTDVVSLSYKKIGDISIINGAQTVSTAANFFLDSDCSKEELEAAKRYAKVLLRIVCIDEGSEQLTNDISISLNRQKPITVEDIVYTDPNILEINQLYQSDTTGRGSPYFYIAKRGEQTMKGNVCTISDFTRACMAYYCRKPGNARTWSSQGIIDEIFNLAELKDQNIADVFNKMFKPVNFCLDLIRIYESRAKKYTDNDVKKIILKNGRYYFAAYVITLLNDPENDFTKLKDMSDDSEKADFFKTDFTEFNYTIDDNDKADELIKAYIAVIENTLSEEEAQYLSSNDFKNQELFNRLFPTEQTVSFIEYLKNYFYDEE